MVSTFLKDAGVNETIFALSKELLTLDEGRMGREFIAQFFLLLYV
jgi:hypothetical protein